MIFNHSVLAGCLWIVQYSVYKEVQEKIHQALSLASRRTNEDQRNRNLEAPKRYYSRTQITNAARVWCVPDDDPQPMFDSVEIDGDVPCRNNNTLDYDLQSHLEAVKVRNGCHFSETKEIKPKTCNGIRPMTDSIGEHEHRQCEQSLAYVELMSKPTRFNGFKFTTL